MDRGPCGRAKAAGASSSLAVPARGPSGLGSQSPATGPPGTRLGRDGGCAKAAEVPSAAPNYQRSSSRRPSSITYPLPDFFFSDPRREYPQSPLSMHPPARWEIILRWGAMLQAAEVSLAGGRVSPLYKPIYSTDHLPSP